MKYFINAFNTYRDIDEWRRTIKSQEFTDSYTNVSGCCTITKPYKFEDYYYRVQNGKVVQSDFPCFMEQDDSFWEVLESHPQYTFPLMEEFMIEITHVYENKNHKIVKQKWEIKINELLSKLHSLIPLDGTFTIYVESDRYKALGYEVKKFSNGYNVMDFYERRTHKFHVNGGIDELAYILALDIATRVVYGGQKLRKLWRVFNWFKHNDVITDYITQ